MNSSADRNALLGEVRHLLETIDRQRDALRDEDSPRSNRHARANHARIRKILSSGDEGRSAIEALMAHPLPLARLSAAAALLPHQPEPAIPVLGRLLIDDLGPDASVDKRIEIRVSAGATLYTHFGFTRFDRDDLIEPPRRYGVAVPPRVR